MANLLLIGQREEDDDDEYAALETEDDLMMRLALVDEDNSDSGIRGASSSKAPSKASASSSSSQRSGVSFAMDDQEEDRQDLLNDQQRSRVDLLAKIARLKDALREVEKKHDAEKERSKKKGKNLVKLAKELKKRSAQKESDIDRLEELEEKKRYLEHHWLLSQKELDQEKALRAKLQTEAERRFDQTLEEERIKYSKAIAEHVSRLADQQRSHQAQCDELGREILKATLEADRLHQELTDKGINVPRWVLFKKETTSTTPSVLFAVLALLSIVLAMGAWMGSNVDLRGGMCSPVMPGSKLTESDADHIFVAPWWSPPSHKEMAFRQFCSGNDSRSDAMVPTSIQWSKNGKSQKMVLTVDGKVKLKRSLAKAEVTGSSMRLWKRNGHAEEQSSLW